MSSPKVLFGFHAVGVRLKTASASVIEVYADPTRRDARMKQFLSRAAETGVRVIEADAARLTKLAGSAGHQGVAARVQALEGVRTLDELLDDLAEQGTVPLLLVLDGVTDPHNLGACLRVADGAGAHAVIAEQKYALDMGVRFHVQVSSVADFNYGFGLFRGHFGQVFVVMGCLNHNFVSSIGRSR